MNITIIYLNNLKLKTFKEQDAEDYCSINGINRLDITELYLYKNQLIDISGIKLFKNLEILQLRQNELTDISVLKNLNKLKILSLGNNPITDISVIQYLTELRSLNIENLKSDQIKYIKSLKNLKELLCKDGFKNMNVLKQLNNNINIIK